MFEIITSHNIGFVQVVSGAMGKEKVHYEAVKPALVKPEMDKFLNWFNHKNRFDPILKAAIAHFWFIIIHPFDGGNGRIEKLQTSKWAKMAKTSTDTALRDIKDLVEKGILQATPEGGRNVNYELVDFKIE